MRRYSTIVLVLLLGSPLTCAGDGTATAPATQPQAKSTPSRVMFLQVYPRGRPGEGQAPVEDWIIHEMKSLGHEYAEGMAGGWVELTGRPYTAHDSRHYGLAVLRLAKVTEEEVSIVISGRQRDQDVTVTLANRPGSHKLIKHTISSSIASMNLYLAFAVTGQPAGASSPAAATAASGPAEGRRSPVRVVPQLGYEAAGLRDPTGRFAVARATRLLSGLRIVDLKRKRLAWIVEPSPAYRPGRLSGFAFSRDGRWLAFCSPGGGQMLDLAADRVKPSPWLKGIVPIFSPDDKLIYVTASSKDRPRWPGRGYVDEVRVYDLRGKIVKSYPLRMNMVGRLSFSKDGQTLIVDGGTGVGLENRAGGTFTPSHQIIDLKTGESMSIDSPEAKNSFAFGPGPSADFDAMNLRTIPMPSATLNQQLTSMLWDASTGSIAVIGRGQPEGGTIKLWNLKEAKFARTVAKSNNLRNTALLRPGLLLGTAWHDRETLPPELAEFPTPKGHHGSSTPYLVTLVQLPEGTTRPLGISARDWTQCRPSPDGRHLAGLIAQPVQDFTYRLQIWDTSRSALVGEISNPKQPIYGFQWTSDGRLLIVLLRGEDEKQRWEFFTPEGDSAGVVLGVSDWGFTFSPSGNLVAVQAKGPRADAWTDTYRTSVRKSRTGEEVATFPGTTLLSETRFIDEDRLLIAASRRAGDPVRLVRISDRKVIWETKAAGDVRKMSWQPDWKAVVIHYSTDGRADVLSIKDGQRLPGGGHRAGWYNPMLLHGGRLALDPYCGSTILRLKETATGRTVATCAAFADPEWIVFTPEGLWTGSAKALDWVAFYRGAEPLTPEEVTALRQPEAVQARLAAAFR